MYERRITAQKVYAEFLRRPVERFAYQICLFGKGRRDKTCGRDRYALVDDGYAVFPRKIGGDPYDVFRLLADGIVNGCRGFLRRRTDAGEKRYPHSDRADIQMLPLDHVYSFQYVVLVKHILLRFPLNIVHGVEDRLMLQTDRHTDLVAQFLAIFGKRGKFQFALADIHEHDHRKVFLQERLTDIFDIDAALREKRAHFCDNAFFVFSRNRKYYKLIAYLSVGLKQVNESKFLRYEDYETKDGVDLYILIFSEWNAKKSEYMDRKIMFDKEKPLPEFQGGDIVRYLSQGNLMVAYEVIGHDDSFVDEKGKEDKRNNLQEI